MLEDTPRKILRILYNHRGVPSIAELARMAVRTPGQVKMALRALAVTGYILWDQERHFELKVLQGWEAKPEEIDTKRWWERELYPGR